MTVQLYEKINTEILLSIAKEMIVAAKTAPKGRGIDNLAYAIVDGKDIETLSQKMDEIGQRKKSPSYLRDAKNILSAPVIVLIGTKISSLGLKDACQLCGYENCSDREKQRPVTPCIFNSHDLGIAVGSAVSVAMDHRVDNRIMYSIGQAVKELKWMDENVKIIMGIPLSATEKNVFFDRKV